MKSLKKISLVYTLQIFAVIILFGYAVASPKNQMKEAISKKMIPLQMNLNITPIANQDSLSDEKINILRKHIVKSR